MIATSPKSPRSVTWLALSLSLGYFALMATLMWFFEHAITLNDISEAFENPGRAKAWGVIGVTALVIFGISRWALGRISTPSGGSVARFGSSTKSQALADPQQSSRSWLDVIVFLSAVALILAGTGAYIISEQEKTLDSARYRQFTVVGKMKAQSVSRWVDERQRDLLILLENDQFISNLKLWMDAATRAGGVGEALRSDLEAVLDANGFDGIAVVGRKGNVSLSVPDDLRARNQCRQAAIDLETVPKQQVSLSFAFDGVKGFPKVDAIGMAFDSGATARRPLATLCLRIDLNQRLLPIVSQWPGMATSGEIRLGRADGKDIVVLNSRVGTDARWTMQRVSGARAQWEAALHSADGSQLHEALAGNGTRKLLATYLVKGTPWMLMVRMDGAEADRLQFRRQTHGTVVVGFILIFVVAAFAVAWARTSFGRESFHAQRDALLSELREMAYYDELTGLPRRRLIQDRLDVAVRDAERRGETVGVLFVDLDKFKAVNDSHGHAAGDFVLKAVAERLQTSLRKNDSAGRLSGDEFLVILTGNADMVALEHMRDKLAQTLRAPLQWGGKSISVGVSIGLAVYPQDGADSEELIAKADGAMYLEKKAGR